MTIYCDLCYSYVVMHGYEVGGGKRVLVCDTCNQRIFVDTWKGYIENVSQHFDLYQEKKKDRLHNKKINISGNEI